MTELNDKLTAAAATLSAQHGVTADQVKSIVGQATAPFRDSIASILASEKSGEDKISDIETSLEDFAAGVNPPATPAPDAAAPAPDAIAPAPVADPAPETPAA